MVEFFQAWSAAMETDRWKAKRPLVSLCYAQSLDGSLTAHPGEPTTLSGPESSKLTHQLRAAHDAILVGIGTVLADNPSLTVRLVEGPHPQPIILDSRLHTPANIYLLSAHPTPAWIATAQENIHRAKTQAEYAGIRLLPLPTDENGHISLQALLEMLPEMGIRRLMVEGGAQVLTSFLAQGLADQVILTIAPRFTGGLHIAERESPDLLSTAALPQLASVQYHRLGDDLIVWGTF